MYHIVIGIDKNESHARLCVEEVLEMPGDPSKKHVTLVHSFTDDASGVSATKLTPVRAASDMLEAAGIEYDVVESSGDPAEAIIETAEEVSANLVVVGGRKRSPAGKALFGSVTQSVILDGNRPVMVTGSPGSS